MRCPKCHSTNLTLITPPLNTGLIYCLNCHTAYDLNHPLPIPYYDNILHP